MLENEIDKLISNGFELKGSLQIRTFLSGEDYLCRVTKYTQVMVSYDN